MKAKLTVTVDEELIPRAKEYARSQGVSLSQLIETSLRQVSTEPTRTFSQRWRGKFVPADRDDDRYRALAKRYL
ncbi:MAG: hypothetical protein GY719_13765 [bacterium]|nr:hypothetical protein [bacterium]